MKTYVSTFLWLVLLISFTSIYIFKINSMANLDEFENAFSISLLTFGFIIVGVIIEWLIPIDKMNNELNIETANNITYIIISSFAETAGKTLALFTFPILAGAFANWEVSLWPTNWPVALQILLGVLIYDFVYYWYHRISHHSGLLWRFHRLHHSTVQLNLLALNRFHFIDIILELFILTTIFTILQIPIKVFFLMQAFMIPVTLLSHANFPVVLPKFLRWIAISPKTHRIHHASIPELHDKNFGGFSLFWDIIFRTYESGEDISPYATGLENRRISKWIWMQLADFLQKD